VNAAHALGRRGEDLAAEHLSAQGFAILSRNWRCPAGELDLVVTDGSALIVCEVKTRSSSDYGAPAEAITRTKARHIRSATHAWLRRYRIGALPIRFDVLSILWPADDQPSVEHLRGAF
jgi:putative endonuclease